MHVPVLEFFHLIRWLMDNRPFHAISQHFCLALIALAVIGCAGEWIIPLDPDSVPCTRGKFECYEGPPLSLTEFVMDQQASPALFLLPLIYVFAALLVSIQPSRTYLLLLLFVAAAFIINTGSDPEPYTYHLSGIGASLHTLGSSTLIILSIPLAIHEQMTLNPNYDYQGILRYFPGKS